MSLASIMRKNIPREESEKKQSGYKINIIFCIDNIEYFSAETFTDKDPHNLKPISYKYKLFREMKDQLDRLLKKLKFTKEMIKMKVSETCFIHLKKVLMNNIKKYSESLNALKNVLKLKNDIIGVLKVVNKYDLMLE
ncbi:969_t:CDS:2 [Funneliformis caledonium]|uniref:969_t:CDS:1 n=1 Tax=Funneliformis caledonium TaxID=1117310 RepID=A0A9N9FKY8_9GLOM|nr:969_t:CDS:2 [Funneliformis caledonium]